jgi:hypothetical protein
VKKNAIHPPFDLYALFLEIKIARMQWVSVCSKTDGEDNVPKNGDFREQKR